MRKKIIPYIIFLILLYLWLFSPEFWIFRGRLVFSNVIDFVCIIICIVKPRIFRDFYQKFKNIFLWLLYFLVLSLVYIVFDFQTGMATQHLVLLVNLFCVMPVLFAFANSIGFGTEQEIVRSMLIICGIAALFSLLCVSFPNVNEYVKYTLIKYDSDSFLFDTDYRGFGFASGLTGNYGFVLGFLVALGGFNLRDNKWFLFVIPFVVVSILVNARSGLFIALAGIACLLLQKKSIVGTIVVVIFSLFLVAYFEQLLSILGLNDETIRWITTFQAEITDVVTERDFSQSNTVESLFGRMIVLPEDGVQWILGRGYELFRNEHGVRTSDIGWINQLNYGGLMYFLPLLLFFYNIVKRISKNKGLGFGLMVLSAIIIANTKGRMFPSYSLFTIIMMIYFVTTPKPWNKYTPQSLAKQ